MSTISPMQPMERHYLDCQCECSEHVIRFVYDPDEGDIFIDVHLHQYHSWYVRLWNAIKYVFGYQCKFGMFDVTLLKPEDYQRLKELMERSEEAHRRLREFFETEKGS